MDDDDPKRLRIVHVAETSLLAVEGDGSLIGAVRVNAAEHLHQRRLARAVLAEKGMDLADLYSKIDIVQRLHACKALADAAHLKHCRHRIISKVQRVPPTLPRQARLCARRRI